MTLICVLYVLIGIKLRNSKTLQGITRDSCEINRSISGQTRIIRMLSKFQIKVSKFFEIATKKTRRKQTTTIIKSNAKKTHSLRGTHDDQMVIVVIEVIFCCHASKSCVLSENWLFLDSRSFFSPIEIVIDLFFVWVICVRLFSWSISMTVAFERISWLWFLAIIIGKARFFLNQKQHINVEINQTIDICWIRQ